MWKKKFYLILSIAHVVAIYDCTVYTVRVHAHNCCLPFSYLGAYYCFRFEESIDVANITNRERTIHHFVVFQLFRKLITIL